LAVAEQHLKSVFNRPGFPVVDNHVFCIVGDGCLQEGVASEACSLAGLLLLHNLTY
jgi:transketolase